MPILNPILVFLAFAAYGALHSLLATRRAKALAARWFEPWGKRWYRLAYNIVGVLTLLPVATLLRALPDALLYTIPSPWNFAAMGVQLLALFALVIGAQQAGGAAFLGLTQLNQEDADLDTPAALQTGGLYRFSRHPLYFFGLVLVWLEPRLTWNLLALNLAITAYILVGMQLEERRLLQEYGQAYRDYQRTTAPLVPFLHLPSSS